MFPRAVYKAGYSVVLGMVALFCGVYVFTLSHNNLYDEPNKFDLAEVRFLTFTRERDLGCMALNVYHEGRGESGLGQAAIAAVTMNRVKSKRYPDTICEVVYQRKQFSWTRLSAKHHAINDFHAWTQALTIAQRFIQGEKVADLGEATHYHAKNVKPYWMDKNKLITTIGNHYFYTRI